LAVPQSEAADYPTPSSTESKTLAPGEEKKRVQNLEKSSVTQVIYQPHDISSNKGNTALMYKFPITYGH